MLQHRSLPARFSWAATLKFKIVAVCVAVAVTATAVTTHFLLESMQASTQRLLLNQDADDREHTAGLLASKIQLLESGLVAVASSITPAQLAEHSALAQFLVDKPTLSALFDATFVSDAQGRLLARLEKGVPGPTSASLAGREYFEQVMKHGLPVISKALVSRVSNAPVVIFAAPIKAPGGAVVGVLGGSLRLGSAGLLSFLTREEGRGASREIVIDSTGTILSHPQPGRVLGRADDEPGMGGAYRHWVDLGRTVHSEGTASLSEGHMVSMAGVPAANWMLVRVTPQAEALRPASESQATAWRVAAAVGLAAGLLAGLLAWAMTRPISQLRGRAERLLSNPEATVESWPDAGGEIGALSRAFQHVVKQVQSRQQETNDLLSRLEAVLHNAEVGVAFTRLSHFELVSRHFCEIFKCEEAQVIGQPSRTIYASEQAYQALADRARPSFMAHGAFDGELELVRLNGERFWAHMRGRAVVPGNLSAGTIWIIEDVTQAREQRERLTWTASHDSLTGLANRAAFETLLEQATLGAGQHPFCALFIDLDRFKQVNDTAGHAAGDAVLRDIAQRLEGQVRQSDTVARLGGDEFAVLLSRCPPAHALAIAEKLRACVEAYVLVWEGKDYGVGASIGLVHVDERLTSCADVLRAADSACYAAKRSGRNRVSLYSHEAAANEPAAPQRNWAT